MENRAALEVLSWFRAYVILQPTPPFALIFSYPPPTRPPVRKHPIFSRTMQSGEPSVADRYRAELNQFASTVWGKPQAVRRPHPAGFEYIHLKGYRSGFRALLGPGIVDEKILVRDEYRIALQTLQTDAYKRGAYVTGHPGIGKTLFLVYLLVELLGQRQKVAVEYPAVQGYALFSDTVAFYSLTDITPLISGDRVWTLSDSRERNQSLPHIFYSDLDYTLPIQATTPKKERWHYWSKQTCAKCYVMDIWTEQEIVNFAQLLGLNGGRMISLHKKWGGSVRLLRSYLETSDQEIEMGYSWDAGLAVEKCRSTITSIMGNNLPEDAPSQFLFCRPLDFATPCIERTLTCAVVPTPTICHFLAEALQKLDCSTRSEFFNILSQRRETLQAARYIIENWFHCFFSAGKSIKCHWLQGRTEVTPLRGPLRGTTNLFSASLNELRAVTNLPCYWVAPPKFPGIDGALIRQDAIFAFSVTKDKSPEGGLEKLQNGLSPNLRGLPRRLVFVGNPDSSVEVTARDWASKTCVPVAWSKVDPVREDVTYRA